MNQPALPDDDVKHQSASALPPLPPPTPRLLGVQYCPAPGSLSCPAVYFTPLSPVHQKYILNVNRDIKTSTLDVT